jgi:hypothetical protein
MGWDDHAEDVVMSRRVYLLGVGLALVALALAFTEWALRPRPGVTEANVRRIRPGMTLTEVTRIFGKLPDEREVLWHGRPLLTYAWYGDLGDAIVTFRKDGRVGQADWSGDQSEPSPLARLRAWLGW